MEDIALDTVNQVGLFFVLGSAGAVILALLRSGSYSWLCSTVFYLLGALAIVTCASAIWQGVQSPQAAEGLAFGVYSGFVGIVCAIGCKATLTKFHRDLDINS